MDARSVGRLAVVAAGEEVGPEPGARRDRPGDGVEDEGDQHGDRDAQDLVAGEERQPVEFVAEDARTAGVHHRQPLDDTEHPERGDDGRDPHDVDEQPVDESDDGADADGDEDPDVGVGAPDHPRRRYASGEGQRRPERDVELAEDRHHRRPDPDDREDRRLAQQQQDVVLGQEGVRGDAEVHRPDGEDDDEALAREEVDGHGGPRSGVPGRVRDRQIRHPVVAGAVSLLASPVVAGAVPSPPV